MGHDFVKFYEKLERNDATVSRITTGKYGSEFKESE